MSSIFIDSNDEKDFMKLNEVSKIYNIASKFIKGKGSQVVAVDNVSLGVKKGECLGLVGESGSGKTTIGKIIVLLEKVTSGRIIFNGKDLTDRKRKELRPIRKKIQMIFQNPLKSINPRESIFQTLDFVLSVNRYKNNDTRIKKVLHDVELSESFLNKYPHEMSGGQLQRVAIARSLILKPEFVIADEPLSALDLSVQAQILKLINSLKEQYGLTMLFISHDLGVVNYLADRVAVIYMGRLMEIGTSEDVFKNPKCPYTKALISAIPNMDPTVRKEEIILNEIIYKERSIGCVFWGRCPYQKNICKSEPPPVRNSENNHKYICHFEF